MKKIAWFLLVGLLAASRVAASDANDVGGGCSCGTFINPASAETANHTHTAGGWMVSFQGMHVDMKDLRAGTSDVAIASVSPVGSAPYGYMVTPTKMTMDMQMLMVMYGITDRLTVMGMANRQTNRMDMLMNMGMGNKPQDPMRTSGMGDVEVRALYQINRFLVGGLGVNLPTGGIEEKTTMMGMDFRAPYDMQLGTGTWDLKPSLTISDSSRDSLWNWGVQASSTLHPWNNKNGYHFGDSLKLAGWLQRALGPVTTALRLAYGTTARIHGEDLEIAKILDPMMGAPMPDADPRNYGGQRIDGILGASYRIGHWSVGVEGGLPLYQKLNGLQLKTGWTLAAGVSFLMM